MRLMSETRDLYIGLEGGRDPPPWFLLFTAVCHCPACLVMAWKGKGHRPFLEEMEKMGTNLNFLSLTFDPRKKNTLLDLFSFPIFVLHILITCCLFFLSCMKNSFFFFGSHATFKAREECKNMCMQFILQDHRFYASILARTRLRVFFVFVGCFCCCRCC